MFFFQIVLVILFYQQWKIKSLRTLLAVNATHYCVFYCDYSYYYDYGRTILYIRRS